MESSQSSSAQKTNIDRDKTHTRTPTKTKIKNHPRRFSDEQIKSLESIFKLEPKLDSRNKLQIARDLGLQPRQVAIWFQNKRARWRSKQIEQEYRLLKSSYDGLSMRFDDLKRENQSLQMQLQEVNDRLKNQFDDVSLMYGDEEKIFTSCFDRVEEEEEEEEEMSQTWRNLSASFENPYWLQS